MPRVHRRCLFIVHWLLQIFYKPATRASNPIVNSSIWNLQAESTCTISTYYLIMIYKYDKLTYFTKKHSGLYSKYVSIISIMSANQNMFGHMVYMYLYYVYNFICLH